VHQARRSTPLLLPGRRQNAQCLSPTHPSRWKTTYFILSLPLISSYLISLLLLRPKFLFLSLMHRGRPHRPRTPAQDNPFYSNAQDSPYFASDTGISEQVHYTTVLVDSFLCSAQDYCQPFYFTRCWLLNRSDNGQRCCFHHYRLSPTSDPSHT
jgi:hypothetical protein